MYGQALNINSMVVLISIWPIPVSSTLTTIIIRIPTGTSQPQTIGQKGGSNAQSRFRLSLWLRYESWNKLYLLPFRKSSAIHQQRQQKQTSEFHTTSGQIIDRWKIYVDQSHTLPREWTLNYGTSLTYASDHNTQFYHTQNGTDMSELNTDNRYNEYTYDFYVGFSKNMGERLSFSASITGEYYKTARYHAWAAYPTAELTYVMTPAHILQLAFTSDKPIPATGI